MGAGCYLDSSYFITFSTGFFSTLAAGCSYFSLTGAYSNTDLIGSAIGSS
jgi:hypothetical protein